MSHLADRNKSKFARGKQRMDFGILGSLIVSSDSHRVDLGGPRQRRLLAALILSRNQVVSTDRLIDIVFEQEPTAGAKTTIRSYVARLRKALDEHQSGAEQLILTESPGYVLRIGPEGLDADRFWAHVEDGRQQLAEGDAVRAVDTFQDALAMWRGPAFDEFSYEDWSRVEAARLDEQRVVAEENLVDALLECGMATEAISRLHQLIEDLPLRDHFRGQLMLALYRTGRQVEALRSFEDYRRTLVDVALEPSPELVALDRRIAVQDPALRLEVPAGRSLRGYRLNGEIGRGNHALVYRAVQPGVGREVAVKVIGPELADDPGFIRRFDTEARRVSNLQHPNIVPLYDFWREPGGAYLVMRLLPGDLSDELMEGPLDGPAVLRLAQQLGSGLTTAHRAAVSHGGINPSNVLMDNDGNAYLTDFGVTTLSSGISPRPSPDPSGYESPEFLAGGPPTPATDQFALAVLLAQAMTGLLPFGRQAVTSQGDHIGSIHLQRPSIPLPVDDVLARATAWEPDERYDDVAAFVEDLALALGDRTPRSAVADDPVNPYKGLRAFTEADTDEFFGRSNIVQELVDRLGRSDASSRFLTLVGASGGGKSSVVHAGLIPRLRAGEVPGSADWFIATMVPGSQPFSELEAALRSISVTGPDRSLTAGGFNEGSVGRMLETSIPNHDPVLLVIDQLEELFTLVGDGAIRTAFLNGIAATVADPESNLRVVATLRADFYDQPLRYHRFGQLIKGGTVAIAALSAAELEEAVRGPAALVSVEVEPALTTEIVADVIDQPAAMPLLQFTLTELFSRRQGRVMTHASYRELGGVEAAVAERADELYDQMSAEDQGISRRLFMRLLAIGQGDTATRRRAKRSDLVSASADPVEVERVIDAFGAARLLTFDRDRVTRAPTVEVAHEALITQWPRLTGWVSEAGDGLRIQTHITESAGSWGRQGRDPGDLYRGARLDSATAWVDRHDDVLIPLEQEFLLASVALNDKEQAAERERSERQLRSNRRLKGLLAGVGLVLVVALLAGFLAVDQRNESREQSARADREARVATVGALAAASETNLAVDPELSTLLALEAVEASGETVLPAAEEALHRSVLNSRLLGTIPIADNGIAHFSPDGTSFLTMGQDLEAVDVWSVDPLERQVTLEESSVVGDAVFSPDGNRIAVTSENQVRLWDVRTGEVERSFDLPGALIPAFSNDGTMLAAGGGASGSTTVWDPGTGAIISELRHPDFGASTFNLAFSPDDSRLAITYRTHQLGTPEDEGFLVWDPSSGQIIQRHDGLVFDVGYSLDGSEIYTSHIGEVKVWDAQSGEQTGSFHQHEGVVLDLHVAADTGVVASSGTPKVFVWDPETLDNSAEMIGHTGEVDGIDITADGSRVVTSSGADRTTRLWDSTPYWSRELVGLPGPDLGLGSRPAGAVAFAPDSATLAATGPDGAISVWDLSEGEQTHTLAGPGPMSFSLAFNSDGSELAAGGIDGVTVHDINSGEELERRADHLVTNTVAFHPADDSLLWAGIMGGVETRSSAGDEAEPVEGSYSLGAVYSADGAMMAVTYDAEGREQRLEIRDTATNEVVAKLEVGRQPDGSGDPGVVNAMAFSPDGALFITGESDGFSVLWDAETFEPLQRLEGHTSEVFSVAFDPTREVVATASVDGTIRTWDTETGQNLLTLPSTGFVTGIAYSPDGRYLAAAALPHPGQPGTVTVYMLDVDDLVTEAESRVTRDFTEIECLRYLNTDSC